MTKGMSDIIYWIKVYCDVRYNVGLRSLQSDIGGSNIRLSPLSLIRDIRLSAHLWFVDGLMRYSDLIEETLNRLKLCSLQVHTSVCTVQHCQLYR